MLLQQAFSKDPASLVYCVDNLSPQPVCWAVFRKKVVAWGVAPLERLSEPAWILPGESAKTPKPEIKLPWKRYIAFADAPEKLAADIDEKKFNELHSIWVDELGTVVLTEQTRESDGVRQLKAMSWAGWVARKKMEPHAAKLSAAHESFTSSMYAKLLADMPPHAYAKTEGRVRHGLELCSQEMQFNAMRLPRVREALQKLTGMDCSGLSDFQTPRIQVCASGGGYRAMISTMGALLGMEETGLLDCVTAMTALSGSTWALASWYSGGMTLKETRAALAEKLSLKFYTNKLWPDTVQAHVKERMGHNQEMSLVDVMGWHLHHHLNRSMSTKPELWHLPRLSEQASLIADGSRPLPIYTAVTHEHKRYRWMEFTPFEVGMAQDVNAFVPTWSFGRRFKNGISTDFALEPSLALLQATWGSAFCATVDQMFHELETPEDKKEPAMQKLMHTLIYDKMEIGENRLLTPALFPNFNAEYQPLKERDHPYCAMKTLKLMDAGVHTNTPFPPLLRPQRHSDIIICLDQSSAPDIYSTVALDITEKWAREEGLPFPDCTEALKPIPPSTERSKFSQANGSVCTVIPGDVSKGIPTVIYLPLLRNDRFDADFCPRLNAQSKDGFCSTFNFAYTMPQVYQLSDLTHANMCDSMPQIVDAIKDVLQKKMTMHAAHPDQVHVQV